MTNTSSHHTQAQFKTLLQRAKELAQEAHDKETEKARVIALQTQLAQEHLNSFLAYVNHSGQIRHPDFALDGGKINIIANSDRLKVNVIDFDIYNVDGDAFYGSLESLTQDEMLDSVFEFLKSVR